ncbi:hypothetical protein ACFP56_10395 [Paenibacillus septentrionalis]|uniref:YhfM-like domain-containing protein n=1 Tax=Paenibacillus septentrionalis TaxID=429342 RepID=A0ABW1V4Z5_9BACL
MRYVVVLLIGVLLISGCSDQTPSSNLAQTPSNYSDQTPSQTNNTKTIKVKYLQKLDTEFTSQDEEIVATFEDIVNQAEKRPGILNYVAEYKLEFINAEQKIGTYHLSLGTDRTMLGLLVNTSNTHQGYEISIEHANRLRELLLER